MTPAGVVPAERRQAMRQGGSAVVALDASIFVKREVLAAWTFD